MVVAIVVAVRLARCGQVIWQSPANVYCLDCHTVVDNPQVMFALQPSGSTVLFLHQNTSVREVLACGQKSIDRIGCSSTVAGDPPRRDQPKMVSTRNLTSFQTRPREFSVDASVVDCCLIGLKKTCEMSGYRALADTLCPG